MAAPLSTKVQALAALAAVFMLLAVPTFLNVLADAGETNGRAQNTVLAKWFVQIAKNWKGSTGDLTVDDWSKQAKKNGCTGPECDPEGDVDHDGRTNRFEYDHRDEGYNPSCNEEEQGGGDLEKGKQVCQGRPTVPTTNPTPTPTPPKNHPVRIDELFNQTIYQSQPQLFTVSLPADGLRDYDRWEVYWNASGFTGANSQYQIVITSETNQTQFCCNQDQPAGFLQQTDSGQQTLDDSVYSRPPPDEYRILLDAQFEPNSQAAVTILGIRNAYTDPGTTAK